MRNAFIATLATLAVLSPSATWAADEYVVTLKVTKSEQFSYQPRLLVTEGAAPAVAELKGTDGSEAVRVRAVSIGDGVFDVTTVVGSGSTEVRPRLLVRAGQAASTRTGDVTISVAVDRS